MDAPDALPTHVTEVDRLRLEVAVLRRDNYRLQEERLELELSRAREARAGAARELGGITQELSERYKLRFGVDRIEMDGSISRRANGEAQARGAGPDVAKPE